jgi:O-antigen ligase
MGLILFLTVLVGEYPKSMKYRVPVMMIAMASLVVSGGRGTFVAGIICMLAYLFLKRHFFLFTSASLVTVLAAAVIFAFPQVTKAIPPSVQRVFEYSAGTETGAAKSLESRFAVWERSMELIEEKPLTGTGFRATEEQMYQYGARDTQELWIEIALRTGSTHNGYLAYAQIFGIFGFGFFLYLFFSHFVRAAKMYFRHVDPLVLQLSLLLLLTLVARSVILFGGGGGPGKDTEFYLYIGLIQASWLLVLKNQRRPEEDKTEPVERELTDKPRLVSALGK